MAKIVRTVTIGIIAYNEHKYLPDLLNDLLEQTYPKELIEVIFVDGVSTDNTWQIMQEFKKNHDKAYRSVLLLKNLKRVQPAGWNMVIQRFSTDIMLRIDAHARIPKDFVEKNVSCINSGEYVCGGPRENIVDEDTQWKRMLLSVEQSIFGSGIASYRKPTDKKKYVKSVFQGAYRREVIENVGLFNEELIRTEDNEYHYRVREAGYQICYDPTIKSFYQTRSSLQGMIRQKYQNGLWIGKTLLICPGCISMFHLIPAIFVISIVLSIIIGLLISWVPLTIIGTVYCLFLILSTFTRFVHTKQSTELLMLFIIPLIHIVYGMGTVKGCTDMMINKVKQIVVKE